MFHHVKDLQFDVRVSEPDPRFARLLLEQFGGGNGELKAAMQYFTQAFSCRRPYPDKYDLLMDIATEEFSHLEIVGALITLLLDGVNPEMKNAVERSSLANVMNGRAGKESFIHEALTNPQFLVLSGGGPTVTDSVGTPWSGNYVNANGDLTVDLRSNIAAESRAKIVYEYLMQFTDDELVKDSLRFLMTREIAHFQMFTAALDTLQPNFPPGVLQGDPRFTHTYFDMSEGGGNGSGGRRGGQVRGPWNDGQGPWDQGEWAFIDDPIRHVRETRGLREEEIMGSEHSPREVEQMEEELSQERREEATVPRNRGQAMRF
ncbi:MAG: manganese catalase family protein [Hyphomicrobiaceae bacterium]